MDGDWTGKAVSIECDPKLGIFQGYISKCTPSEITIVRAFRNGVPLRKQDAEVTLRCNDILKINLIPAYSGHSSVAPNVLNKPTPVKQPNFAIAGNGAAAAAAAAATTTTTMLAAGTNGNHSHLNNNNSMKKASSALSSKLSNMKINNTLLNNTTPTSSRSPSVQQNMYSLKSSPPLSTTPSTSNSVAQFFGNLIPPKVEIRLGAGGIGSSASICSNSNSYTAESYGSSSGASSKPIDIVQNRAYQQNNAGASTSCNGGGVSKHHRNGAAAIGNGYSSASSINGNGGGACGGVGGPGASASRNGKQRNKQLRRENSIKYSQTFGTSVDDPQLHEDFDFEGNLALFDKQAIWNSLDSGKKPDLVQHAMAMSAQKQQHQQQQQLKYRHDENILLSEPAQLRQIESMFEGSNDFVTDEGLIIPTIPTFARAKIEICAEKCGLSLQRQIDLLGRGATDLAILLLGGARRLNPNNRHQWPTIAIICEKSDNFRSSNIGASTGRQLASHGLKVLLYLEENANIEQKSIEISLFKATGNAVVYSVNDLPTPDIVILSTNSINLSSDVKKWLSENRASILAIDPPPSGIRDVSIKYSIIPILPLNGISSNTCGKLYLCNTGIPDKFYQDAGIKYKSPFGHKFVIPIHNSN